MRPTDVANLGRVGALAIGLPLGVALGRWTCSLLADRIGLGAPPWPSGAGSGPGSSLGVQP